MVELNKGITTLKKGIESFLPPSSHPVSDSYCPIFGSLGDNFGFSRLTLKERLEQKVHDMKNPLSAVRMGSEVVKDFNPIFSDDCDIVWAKTTELRDLINSYLRNSTRDNYEGIKSIIGDLDDLDIFNNIGAEDRKTPFGAMRNSYATLSSMVELLDSNNNSNENAYSLLTLLVEKAKNKYSDHSGVKVDEIIKDDLKTHPLNVEDFGTIFNILMDNGVQAMDYRGSIKLSAGTKEDNLYMDFKDEGRGMPQRLASRLESSKGMITYDKQNGSGFGLYLVKKLIHRYDGKLSISSKEGLGTNMGISIPLSGLYNFAAQTQFSLSQ